MLMSGPNATREFMKKHWFKLSLLALGIFTVWTVYSALVIQPEKARWEETLRAEATRLAEESNERLRQANLELCLSESEYQETSSHLWMCSSIGRVQKSCGDVFGGARSIFDALNNYRTVFGVSITQQQDIASKFETFIETCNCGLEKYRRDELGQEKIDRDKLCIEKYGK